MSGGRVVRQNGEKLVKISQDLIAQAGTFKTLYDQFFDEIDTNLSDSDDTKIWWGVRAQGCRKKAEQTRPTFDEMKQSIEKLANKVEEHATTYGTMDSSGY